MPRQSGRSQPENHNQGEWPLHLLFLPHSGCWESSTNASTIFPSISDSISFISFIASTMQSIWPFLTTSPTSTYDSPPGVGDLKNVPTMGERTVKYLSSITSAVIAWALLKL